jgi:hypothetical protein
LEIGFDEHAGRARALHRRDGSRGFARVPADDHNRFGAVAGGALGDRQANALGCARDQDGLPLQWRSPAEPLMDLRA